MPRQKKNKFIVPIVFSLDDYSFAPNLYVRPFYGFIYFAYKNNLPIIIQERYIVDPEALRRNETTSYYFDDWSREQFGFEMIRKKDIDEIDKYIISNETVDKICAPFKSQSDAFIDVLRKGNKVLEKKLLDYIDEIEGKYKRKIDAFMVWVNNKSIEAICKKRGIKLIQMETGPMRPPAYATSLAYCMDRDKYDNVFVKEEFDEFKRKIPSKELLSKDELLALFLNEVDGYYLYKKNKTPEYDFGLAFSFPGDYFFNLHSNYSNEKIYEKVLKIVDNNKVIVRSHPSSEYKLKGEPNYDKSVFSKDFILSSKTIVSGVSNINFEAILFGRKSISTSYNMPWSFLDGSDLDYIPESEIDASFLNYLVFCYFAPEKEMFDLKYLNYKFFEKHDMYDLYKKNRKILLEKRGLDERIFKLHPKDRLKKIIKTCFSEELFKQYISYNYDQELKKEIDELRKELTRIESSKGYKYLMRFWRIKGRLKK